MEKEVFLWLGLMILFLVVELATVGLTSIWLAGGALIALFVALAGATVYRGISSAPDFYEAFCNEIYQQAS